MDRRNFLIKLLLWILTFIFGHRAIHALEKEIEGSDSIMIKDKNERVNSEKIGVLNEQLAETVAKTVGEYNIQEFVGIDSLVTSSVVQRAIDTIPSGSTLKFPTDSYEFDSIIINKSTTIDLQNSTVISTAVNKNIFEVQGGEEAKKYLLATPANRKDKKIYLNRVPIRYNPGDLIVLRDDSVRFSDGNPDMNVEIHEIASINLIEKSITLKDFVRLPKSVSTTNNVYKIIPSERIKIKNAELRLKEGSTSGSPIKADLTRWLELKNINIKRSAGACILVKRSYGFKLSDFNFSEPQVTGSGQGYGIQLFSGVNNFEIRNGYGDGLRHTFDSNSGFDGMVENVVAINNKSSQFVLSHNGWGADITCFKCRAYGGLTYGFQVSSQGLKTPFVNNHYGIRLIECEVQLNFSESMVQCGIVFTTPIKETLISGFKAILGDGTVIPTSHASYGISMKHVDSDVIIENVFVEGFRNGYSFYHNVDIEASDPLASIKLKNVSARNVKDAIVHSHGLSKKLIIDGLSVQNVETSVLRLAEGSFKKLYINNIDISSSPTANIFFTRPVAHLGGLIGDIGNISKDDIPKTALIVRKSQKLTMDQMYGGANNGRLLIQSNSDVILAKYPLVNGFLEGQVFSLFNIGTFNISVDNSSLLHTKTGKTRVLAPKDTMTVQWLGRAWREI